MSVASPAPLAPLSTSLQTSSLSVPQHLHHPQWNPEKRSANTRVMLSSLICLATVSDSEPISIRLCVNVLCLLGPYSRTSCDIWYDSDWSRWQSRPIRSLRYIVTCTRIWALVSFGNISRFVTRLLKRGFGSHVIVHYQVYHGWFRTLKFENVSCQKVNFPAKGWWRTRYRAS